MKKCLILACVFLYVSMYGMGGSMLFFMGGPMRYGDWLDLFGVLS